MRQRIDLALVKERADCEVVFAHFGVELRGSGTERTALCPFHDDHTPSLSVNVQKKVFCCFACGAKGDLLSFVARLEGCSIASAANAIAAISGVPVTETTYPRNRPLKGTERQCGQRGDNRPCGRNNAHRRPRNGEEKANKSLPFTLCLDPEHPYLAERGIARDVLRHFGVGHCSHGSMKGRICIPIHDERGKLVAYAGRWPGDDVPPGQPRYKLPRGFKKHLVLFNLNRVSGTRHVVVVEGYWSTFRLHALGISVVSLMGRSLSDHQIALLSASGIRFVTLLLDGDRAGRAATEEIVPRLSEHFFVYAPAVPDEAKPDAMTEELVRELVRLP